MDWRFPGYFKPKELAENAALMKQQCYGQIGELMKNYGKIDILWYDGSWLAHQGTDADAAWFWEPIKLNSVVRECQPKVVISPRSGWEGDFKVQEGGKPVTGPIIGTPWEKCLNLNKSSWGFNRRQNLMTPQEIVSYLVDTVDRGGNMLLNVGPDRDGVIPPAHVAILKEVGDWLTNYGKSIYGTKAGPFQPRDGAYGTTHRKNIIYVHVKAAGPEPTRLVLPSIGRKLVSSSLLSPGSLRCVQSPAGLDLQIDNPAANGFPAVAELVMEDTGDEIDVQTRN
jgi:alpha-L-fucosidase